MQNIPSLVLNWHLTENCNYRCQYCFAAWESPVCSRDLIHDPTRSIALLEELYRFFQPGNIANPLAKKIAWSSVRLNLVGGEPMLHADKLLPIINHAYNLGFEVSLISNGTYFAEVLLNQLAPRLSWLAVSIDSIIAATNVGIGRVDRSGRLLDTNALAVALAKVRHSNPGLRIKLNTVVNRLNHSENLSPLVTGFSPDKWKVLRMLPVVNQSLTATDEQFAAFVDRHQSFANILYAEDREDMLESYLMVDPVGRFFQNGAMMDGQGYTYSRSIPDVGAAAAFADINFVPERFCSRYSLNDTEKAG